MKNLEKLYESFGELIYVVAMADGIIQEEEISKLEEIVKKHTWGAEIRWSFNYEKTKNEDLDFLYKKVLNFCHQYGPNPEYQKLIEILKEVAASSSGIDEKEKAVINRFTTELTQRFSHDLDREGLIKRLEKDTDGYININ